MKLTGIWAVALGGCLLAGCAPGNRYDDPVARQALRERATECLKRGARYDYLPSVRCQAIESLQDVAPEVGLPWIRHGLTDRHPAVRFAACMALGSLQHADSRECVVKLLQDPDDSVRAAAIFVLHRLGDTSHTALLAAYLKEHEDLAVRRNAALILGRLGEDGAIPLLAGMVNHADDGLHAQALESLALLGNEQAAQQLTFVANSGNGAEEVFAINALAMTRNPRFKGTFEYKLKRGDFRETKLAAARALGEVGVATGPGDALDEALDGIRFNRPQRGIEHDPPENQVLRIKQMAAAALGAIGDPRALPPLADILEEDADPRVQVAAARAVLRIIERLEASSLPFARESAVR